MSTKILNLDEVAAEVDYSIVIAGQTYVMRPPSVGDFMSNMKEIEELGVNADPIKEFELMIRIIQRAFPNLKEEIIRGMSLTQIRAIQNWVRDAGGENVEVDETDEDSEGNEKAAS